MAETTPPDHGPEYDVVVVGGGPAGLSAALWLARYRRRVRVYDAGHPRNEATRTVNGYPGLPAISPDELRRRIADQARGVGAEILDGVVIEITGAKDAFRIVPENEPPVTARRVLLAYGKRDELPEIPGIREAYGMTVHHCPDCDGPSALGLPIAVIGWGRQCAALALFLLTWTRQITLLTHGHDPDLDHRTTSVLEKNGIQLRTNRISRIVQDGGRVSQVEFEDGERLAIDHIFFHLGSGPASDLGDRLGCRKCETGDLDVDHGQETSVSGVYAAGDITGRPSLAVFAATDGIRAALAIHRSLLPPEYEM